MAETEQRQARPRVREQLELEVTSLAYGGRGVARRNGYVVFVSGALPGDRVRASVTKSKRNHAEATAVELLRPSPDRVPDRCDHGGEPCPGAPWQGLSYEQQLSYKQEQVEDSLRRLGGLDGFELAPIEPAAERWRYRNKLEYSFGERDGELVLGFHARGRWDEIVDARDCLLASERNNERRTDLHQSLLIEWHSTPHLYARISITIPHAQRKAAPRGHSVVASCAGWHRHR